MRELTSSKTYIDWCVKHQTYIIGKGFKKDEARVAGMSKAVTNRFAHIDEPVQALDKPEYSGGSAGAEFFTKGIRQLHYGYIPVFTKGDIGQDPRNVEYKHVKLWSIPELTGLQEDCAAVFENDVCTQRFIDYYEHVYKIIAFYMKHPEFDWGCMPAPKTIKPKPEFDWNEWSDCDCQSYDIECLIEEAQEGMVPVADDLKDCTDDTIKLKLLNAMSVAELHELKMMALGIMNKSYWDEDFRLYCNFLYSLCDYHEDRLDSNRN